MIIKSRLKEYKVIFEQNEEFIQRLANTENAQFVVDKKVYDLYGKYMKDIPEERLYLLEAVEENKVIETALNICEEIIDIPAKRNATIISIGGGIIQDITGFVANIMYRGINWIFVPTTLLSACDSCIGGKTSLNYKKYKNLLGTFYPPDEIHICSHLFQTLSDKDFKSGLGEVVKFNIMDGYQGLQKIEENMEKLLEKDPEVINVFVKTSLNFKKKFIEQDEFDRGERVKLNFAHTFGHAIEVITQYEIPHGTAVAAGMIMANYISFARGLIQEDIVKRSEHLLLKVIDINIELLERPLEEYLQAIRKDKKQTGNSCTVVLITNYNSGAELQVVHGVTQNEIKEAIEHFKQIYRKEK